MPQTAMIMSMTPEAAKTAHQKNCHTLRNELDADPDVAADARRIGASDGVPRPLHRSPQVTV